MKDELSPRAQTAYERAKESKLFDDIRVVGPKEAFKRVRISMRIPTDPVVIGKIGNKNFLIAQFDLGEDQKIKKAK